MSRVARCRVLFIGAVCLAGLAACGQTRAEPEALDEATAARLGVTPDAQDPTQRDLDRGYYKWRAKPETEGTYDPTSPERRKVGGPNP